MLTSYIFYNLNSNFDTKADKTQISNPNLLDNPWFNVNSKGKNEYTQDKYPIDRWIFANYPSGLSLEVLEDGIKLINTTGGTIWLNQIIDKDIWDKNITISVMLEDNSIIYKSGVIGEFGLPAYNNKVDIYFEKSLKTIHIVTRTIGTYIIKAIKVELGLISTLHLDVAPDVEQERLKCMLSTADTTDTYTNKGAYTEDLWNSTKTYVVGEYCIYNGSMWKCLVENSGVTPVEGNTWTATSIGSEFASIISKIDALSS